jgi:hypothetical protein
MKQGTYVCPYCGANISILLKHMLSKFIGIKYKNSY